MSAIIDPLIALQAVTVRVGEVMAVEGVEFEVHERERVALVGPSGAGKSTILGVLNGTVRPTSGRVRVLGQDPAANDPEARRVRSGIGTIHQRLHLVGPLQVIHNVNAGHLGRWSLRRALWSLVRPQELEIARSALTSVGIGGRVRERTDRLSGGEQQRVALARVLVQDPDVILADEPVSSLDPARAREVMDLLCGLADTLGKTLVVSLHAFDLARSHCDRIIGLRDGRVLFDLPAHLVEEGMATDLYQLADA